MLTPKHCSQVAVINAGERFCLEKTVEDLLGNLIFYLTKYVILREREGELTSGERASIIEVNTEGEKGEFLRTIVGGKVLAAPKECLTLYDPNIDEFALNQVVLRVASVKSSEKVKAVILSGRNKNITFVYFGNQKISPPLKIMLVDVTPPRPSRLEILSRTAFVSGLISELIEIRSSNVNTSEKINEAIKGGRLVFTPCLTDEILALNPSFSSFKALVKSKSNDAKDLFGCSLSLTVLRELGRKMKTDFQASLRDICPLHEVRGLGADVQGFIVRCCKVVEDMKTIHIRGKPIIVLPWTPSLGDFVKAIDYMVTLVMGLMVD